MSFAKRLISIHSLQFTLLKRRIDFKTNQLLIRKGMFFEGIRLYLSRGVLKYLDKIMSNKVNIIFERVKLSSEASKYGDFFFFLLNEL